MSSYYVPNTVLGSGTIAGICGVFWVSQVEQWSRIHLPIQETQVRSVEKEMATHSSILAWKISWTEEPGGLQSMGSQSVTF